MLKHTDFVLAILESIKLRQGGVMVYEEVIRGVMGSVDPLDLRPDVAVDIVQKAAVRFHCDLTQPLSLSDQGLLAVQFATIFMSFGRVHARQCPQCDDVRGASVVLTRFMNTYLLKHVLGYIPADFPERDQYFFLDEVQDYTVSDGSDHGLDGEQLRERVRDWNVTGGH